MKFSVLMSIYAKEQPERFDRAMQSIWDDQTLKPDQIVLVKDGPLPSDLDDVIDTWREKLGEILVVVPLEHNVGLGAALNKGLEHCSHDLVARMDTDDISLPHRFEEQVAFMRDNPDIAVSSAWLEEIDESGQVFSLRKLPEKHEELIKFAQKRNPIAHPVAVFRKNAVLDVGGYPLLRKVQDFALWSVVLQRGYKIANVGSVLLRMRINNNFWVRRSVSYFKYEFAVINFQRKIRFISFPMFLFSCMTRIFVRFSPQCVRQILYKYCRY